MDWNVPRCAATDPEHGLRCAQTPDHDNPHAAIWTRPRGPVRLRRWRDGEAPVDTGRDQFGDLVPAAGDVLGGWLPGARGGAVRLAAG